MERGDQLIVESLPFESTVNLEPPGPAPAPPAAPLTPFEQLKKNPKMLYGAAGGAAVLLAGLFFLVFKMLKKSPAPPAQVRQTESLPPAGAEPAAAQRVGGADTWAPSSLGASSLPALAPARIEVLTNQIRETAQKTERSAPACCADGSARNKPKPWLLPRTLQFFPAFRKPRFC